MTDGSATVAPIERPVTKEDSRRTPRMRPNAVPATSLGSLSRRSASRCVRSGRERTGTRNENLCKAINGLGDGLTGLAQAFTFLGSIWFVGIVVVLLVLVRRPAAARDAGIAGAGAWLVAIFINALAETQSVSSLEVRTGDGPVFLTASVATATALLIAVAPYVVRPYRRLGVLVVAGVAVAAVYLGTGLASMCSAASSSVSSPGPRCTSRSARRAADPR